MSDGYEEALARYFERSPNGVLNKLRDFPKYAPRTTLARFLARYEAFKQILDVQGSVVECGVFRGSSLLTWYQLSSILEPTNHQRRIIGFDTFKGFPSVSEEDRSGENTALCREGTFAADSYEDIKRCVQVHDKARCYNRIKKVELVRGDIKQTVPRYIEENKHVMVSLLHLDVDLYEPTRIALENFVPRMPKNGIVVFDQLNCAEWPGETLALQHELGFRFKARRPLIGTSISYMVVGDD